MSSHRIGRLSFLDAPMPEISLSKSNGALDWDALAHMKRAGGNIVRFGERADNANLLYLQPGTRNILTRALEFLSGAANARRTKAVNACAAIESDLKAKHLSDAPALREQLATLRFEANSRGGFRASTLQQLVKAKIEAEAHQRSRVGMEVAAKAALDVMTGLGAPRPGASGHPPTPNIPRGWMRGLAAMAFRTQDESDGAPA